jgi:hypothetical protein
MVEARQLWWAGLCLLGSAACAGPPEVAADMIPVAKAITIYSAGGSVVSGVIDPDVLGARRLRLPATVTAITLSQGDHSVKWFTVQAIEDSKKDVTRKLIGLPSLDARELKFSYELPDITWALQLRAEITD